jgi:site-specific recombinase XerD
VFLSEAIEDFREFMIHEAGYTKSTRHAYLSYIRNWARWLNESGFGDPQVTDITEAMIRRYSYGKGKQGCRPRTIRSALQGVRALLTWLHEQEAIPTNPADRIRAPKNDAAIRRTVDDGVLEQLLEAAGRQADDFRAIRDTAVLSVLIFTGIRRQELLDLEVGHVNLADQSLLIQQGKGKKSRVVPLCPKAVEALQDWMAWRTSHSVKHPYLFTDWGRRRMGDNSLTKLVREVAAIAGYKGDPRIKPHGIRHAAATRLMRNGADIRSIQQWLGHSQLETTCLYLHTDEQQIRKIAGLADFSTTPEKPAKRERPLADQKRSEFVRQRRSAK